MTQQHVNPGMFGGMRAAQSQNMSKSSYPVAGHYWYRLDAVKLSQTRKSVNCVIVEMTVIHAFNDGKGALPGQEGYTGHTEGEPVSKVFMQTSDYFVQDVNNFLSATSNLPDEQVDENFAMLVCGYDAAGNPTNDKPLDGKFIVIDVLNKLNSEGTYTNTYWQGVPEWSKIKTTLSADQVARSMTDAQNFNYVDYYFGQEQAALGAPAVAAAPVQPVAPVAPVQQSYAPAPEQPPAQPAAYASTQPAAAGVMPPPYPAPGPVVAPLAPQAAPVPQAAQHPQAQGLHQPTYPAPVPAAPVYAPAPAAPVPVAPVYAPPAAPAPGGMFPQGVQ